MRGSARLRRGMRTQNRNGFVGTIALLSLVACPALAVGTLAASAAINFVAEKRERAEIAAQNARENSRRK